MSKIYNSLILNNEIWALELRLDYEYQFFDKIFITESRQSFSGDNKILYFEKYFKKFKKYADKIEYLIIDELPSVELIEYVGFDGRKAKENRWPLEAFQRNFCKVKILEHMSQPDDTVVVQDVDEIFPTDQLKFLSENISEFRYVSLYLNDYRGSVYKKDKAKELFRGGYICCRDIFESYDLHDIRRCYMESGANVAWHIANPGSASKLDGSAMYHQYALDFPLNSSLELGLKSGWHLTNMTGGDTSLMVNKLMSFSHSEYSPDRQANLILRDCYEDLSIFLHSRSVKFVSEDIDENLPNFIAEKVDSKSILIY